MGDAGRLVPDKFLTDLVKDRIGQADCKERGCLLDGFPRTASQAQSFVDDGLKVDAFVLSRARRCSQRFTWETTSQSTKSPGIGGTISAVMWLFSERQRHARSSLDSPSTARSG